MTALDRGCVKTRFLAGTAKYYCGRSGDYGRMQHDLSDNLPSAVEPCARIRRDYVFTQPRPSADSYAPARSAAFASRASAAAIIALKSGLSAIASRSGSIRMWFSHM